MVGGVDGSASTGAVVGSGRNAALKAVEGGVAQAELEFDSVFL